MWYLGVIKNKNIHPMLGPFNTEAETHLYKKQVINFMEKCGYYDAVWFTYCSYRPSGNTLYPGRLNQFINCPTMSNTEAMRARLLASVE